MPRSPGRLPGAPASGDALPVWQRRRRVVVAGHKGGAELGRVGLTDPAPEVRAAALGALARLSALAPADVVAALADPAAAVRRRACELAPRSAVPSSGARRDGAPVPGSEPAAVAPEVVRALVSACGEPEPSVCEAACYALGELPPGQVGPDVVPVLVLTAGGHPEPLCREAAVAALGSLGAAQGLPAVIAAMADRPAVRRRAAVALAAFEGPEVEGALQRACNDRDWQVRQVAEDLIGRRRLPQGTARPAQRPPAP